MLVWMGRHGRQNIVDLAERISMVDLRNYVVLLDKLLDKEKPQT